MAEPHIVVHGVVGWVYGVEQAKRGFKKGKISGGLNFGTSTFVKEGERWVLTFHQAVPSGSK